MSSLQCLCLCVNAVCIQTEKKTEEDYKKQHTAAFKSATQRLALSLLAKVSLLPSLSQQHPLQLSLFHSFLSSHQVSVVKPLKPT